MDSLDEVDDILSNFSFDSMEDSFMKLVETSAFKHKSIGVCAKFVLFFSKNERCNEIMYHFLKFLFEKFPDSDEEIHLNFFHLWLRASDEKSLDFQIKCFEEEAHILKKNAQKTRHSLNSAIVQLFDRCSINVFPSSDDDNISESLSSEQFIEKSESLLRSRKANFYRGRLQLLVTHIFPAFNSYFMAKKPASLEIFNTEGNFRHIDLLLQKIVTKPNELTQNDFKIIYSFLEKEECEGHKGIQRPSLRVFTSNDNTFDCEACLQISMMCYCLDEENNRFETLIKKFAKLCNVDADKIINILKNAVSSFLKKEELKTFSEVSPPPLRDNVEDHSDSLLKPYEMEVNELVFGEVNNDDEQVTLDFLKNKMGEDKSQWFNQEVSSLDDVFNEWLTARYCTSSNLMDELDHHSFSIGRENHSTPDEDLLHIPGSSIENELVIDQNPNFEEERNAEQNTHSEEEFNIEQSRDLEEEEEEAYLEHNEHYEEEENTQPNRQDDMDSNAEQNEEEQNIQNEEERHIEQNEEEQNIQNGEEGNVEQNQES